MGQHVEVNGFLFGNINISFKIMIDPLPAPPPIYKIRTRITTLLERSGLEPQLPKGTF